MNMASTQPTDVSKEAVTDAVANINQWAALKETAAAAAKAEEESFIKAAGRGTVSEIPPLCKHILFS